MGYCIAYDAQTGAMELRKRKRINKRLITIIIISILVSALLLIPKTRKALKTVLLPGDEQVTERALEGLVADLQEGNTVSEAVEAFCKEIIANE